MNMILTNAKIVREDEVIHGTLIVENGKITDVQTGTTAVAGAVDCEGDLVIPGLVELHTDNLERHMQPRPKVDWPHAAAILAHDSELASVGITTVFDAMRIGSITHPRKGNYDEYARATASELLDIRAKGLLKISHYLHLRAEVCSATLSEELEKFGPEDRVGIVSLMDHTPGQRQFRDLSKLKMYVAGKSNMNDTEFDEHVAMLRGLRAQNGEKHEGDAVAAAKRFGAVLASHDDTTLEHVETSARYGIRLAEFPTTVEAARACKSNNIKVMMGAPNLIRGGSHSGNVAAAELAELDLLDIISSDYVPSALMTSAFLLADLWEDMPRAIAAVSRTPALAAGFSDRGMIEVGLHADLIRVNRSYGTPVIRGVWSHGRQVG